ncbi:universal stress protein [Klenkia terrae]|uniref:universal stress protein n=1 Tax=Klenkia terrae TaxID=1052259 RepID=UPI00361C8BE0
MVNSSRGDALVDEEFLRGDQLRALHDELAASGLQTEIRQPVRGRDVAEELAAACTETGAELLVIGLRKRSAVGKLLMGSAAQRILLDVDCPILGVKSSPGRADRAVEKSTAAGRRPAGQGAVR